ncbi:MAG: hypothetical protein GF403_00025 [Candidatus Coatesbacteria bacterium]|nr:hypothetical protein [Candidatus Coatesbacteria bacterium]
MAIKIHDGSRLKFGYDARGNPRGTCGVGPVQGIQHELRVHRELVGTKKMLVVLFDARTPEDRLAVIDNQLPKLGDYVENRRVEWLHLVDEKLRLAFVYHLVDHYDESALEATLIDMGTSYVIRNTGERFVIRKQATGESAEFDVIYKTNSFVPRQRAYIEHYQKPVDNIEHMIACWEAKKGVEKYAHLDIDKIIAGYRRKLAKAHRKVDWRKRLVTDFDLWKR